jgi:uncharacterized protein (TIGR02145 family)
MKSVFIFSLNIVIIINMFGCGERYETISIKNQIWMVDNLSVSEFSNGDTITYASSDEAWIEADKAKQPAWCYSRNDKGDLKEFGKLYNIYAVKDPRGLAPKGWHIPTDEEFMSLIENFEPAGLFKTQRYFSLVSEKYGGTNKSGFSALMSGERGMGESHDNDDKVTYNTFFSGVGTEATFWTQTSYDEYSNVTFELTFGGYNRVEGNSGSGRGHVVRCVKD